MKVRNNTRKSQCSRRDFLNLVGRGSMAFAFLGTAGQCLLAARNKKTTRRNIVFVLSDDHRYDFMRFIEGAPEFLQTPNMDRMAQLSIGATMKFQKVTVDEARHILKQKEDKVSEENIERS